MKARQPEPAMVPCSDAPARAEADGWAAVPDLFRTANGTLPAPWETMFGPLRCGAIDDLMVVGQLGQSIDGKIATVTGHSKYINGPAGLAHLHRLRAVVDAVVIGIGTALADNPQLTVRHVHGPSPARVVLDPKGRLSPNARVLDDDGVRRLVITCEGTRPVLPEGVEVVALAACDGQIAPAAILAALAARGFGRVLIEGGANTVSRFLAAGCMDRLHVVVAPLIIGTGQAGVVLAPIERVDGALRPIVRPHVLGDEVLLDCDFSAQRIPIGRAKIST
jgi:diaminohydroxyphosphoribosylaminopyrimidine deaminase / 5-amino-6-(5-phosphoribosylamino)uracil reductase